MAKLLGLLAIFSILALVKSNEFSFQTASNQFALDLWKQLSAENGPNQNLLFSPYSIVTTLSMVYFGANGDTEQQLGSALAFKQANLEDKDKLMEQIEKTSKTLFQNSFNSSYSLTSANGMALNQKFQIWDSYRKMIEQKFSGEIFSADFEKNSAAATDQINRWISEKTQHKIQKMLQQPLPIDTVMALINAVYFMGNWKIPFDTKRNKKNDFYGFNGTKYPNVEFMNQLDYFNYTENSELSMVELGYKGDDISLYAFLPNQKGPDALRSMKSSLSLSKIDQLIKQKYSTEIILSLPKFSLESDLKLKPALIAMGVKNLFNERADLSGISTYGPVVVSDVAHLAKIVVNERGSEAAAATKLRMIRMSMKPVANFNRPFVFVIRHNVNGQFLFVGEVNRL